MTVSANVGATVSVHLSPGDVISKSFDGLTAASLVALRQLGDGTWEAQFDGPLTPDETWAVRNRLLSSTSAEETLRTAIAAFDVNTQDLTEVVQQLARIGQLLNGGSDTVAP